MASDRNDSSHDAGEKGRDRLIILFMEFRPYSATILAVCGLILVGIGFYFILVRPTFLPEDARYTGASLREIQVVAPGFTRWLERVFSVLGGYIASTGILTIYVAFTSFRNRTRGAGIIIALVGISSIGLMAVVNFLISSDFKWPLGAIAALWALAVLLYIRDK